MKYKIGDKIKVKKHGHFDMAQKSFYKKNNYILTIKSFDGFYYFMEEDDAFCYPEYCIDGLHIGEEVFNPIESRFEILDL